MFQFNATKYINLKRQSVSMAEIQVLIVFVEIFVVKHKYRAKYSFKSSTSPVKLFNWHDVTHRNARVKITSLKLASFRSLVLFSCPGLHSLFFSCFPWLPHKRSSLGSPCLSLKSPLWRWKNIIWAQFPDRLSPSLRNGPPKANAGGLAYPSTHLSLNTKQTVTQPLHLSAHVSGTCLLGKDNREHTR